MKKRLFVTCSVFLLITGVATANPTALDAPREPILADLPDHYYGGDVPLRQDIKDKLHKVLDSFHISKPGSFDQIVDSCSLEHNIYCYVHNKLGYRNARRYMFGLIYLNDLQPDGYWIPTVYCDDTLTSHQLPEGNTLGPMKIPNANIVNTEHSWPQSHFTNKYSKSMQKSDLHALYPVRMRVNSTRGNHPFGEVVEVKSLPCEEAALGYNENGHTVFEPAESVKGNLARSLFYFSIRYRTPIDAEEEKVLRQWHALDPIDAEEIRKHEEIYKIQFVRNPFIDHPEWVDLVSNF